MKTANLYTKNQKIRFLVDDALFSDSSSARIRAVNELSRDYGQEAVPIIEDIARTIPATDEAFKVFCISVLSRTKAQTGLDEVAGSNSLYARPIR